ncbi:beach-domain-containing protein [Leucogyrophana mollusca]|uniref:Beach-domain-containing protein n=1 Tax=Leucogyrophana mollusca TaxID=85980 RepID=A0ACB8BN80_9AGAM|nr:beach-domain-containing protein [Leucogyrophana mollusca]
MFRSILAPLQSHYGPPVSMLQPPGDARAETAAHKDLLACESMRKHVDELKFASDVESRNKSLSLISNTIRQNASTRDVFRNADGFLVLIHVLSMLPASLENSSVTPDSTPINEIFSCMQDTFLIASEALRDHERNIRFFRESVGYNALSEAVHGLVNNPLTTDMTLGLLLSLAFHDFSLVDIFSSLRTSSQDIMQLDDIFPEFASRLGRIHLPGIFEILWSFLRQRILSDLSFRHISYKLLDHLLHTSHRNFAVLSNMRIIAPFVSLFKVCQQDPHAMDKERRALLKILKRLYDMGASTDDVRNLFRDTVKADGTLDTDMLDIIRSSMRSRWPPHLSLDSGASVTSALGALKALPASGFTFMIWLWLDRPPSEPHKIFSICFGTRAVVKVFMGSNGTLALQTNSSRDIAMLSNSKVAASRWTHITCVHYPHRSSQPTIRLFVDGILTDSLQWAYPKVDDTSGTATFVLGEVSTSSDMAWCIASSYLLSVTLDDDLPRFIHHLGPRYCGPFQDQTLVRFFTYEASTSLNMHILGQASNTPTSPEMSHLKKTIRDGISISDSSIMARLVPSSFSPEETFATSDYTSASQNDGREDGYSIEGGVLATHCQPLDLALWKIGGPALVLRLVMFAQTTHELSRAINILSDSLRNCWQNCDDMERMHGYDVLANLLHTKCHLINMTTFETLFELLGLNFRSPDHSTIVNSIGYRSLALDFELWSRTHPDIQRVHLEHFSFLLRASRFRKFNVKVRLSKLGLVRKLLYVLQSTWYQHESIPSVINALVVVAQASFSSEDTIKPIVSYIAGNLADGHNVLSSPHSSMSRAETSQHAQKAGQVLEALVSMLRLPALYAKFAEALPVARVCLLLLGDQPSPTVAAQVLSLIGISLSASQSFNKKFELASGWAILRAILPPVWNRILHDAALDLLLGRSTGRDSTITDSPVVACPQVALVILAALRQCLAAAAGLGHLANENTSQSEAAGCAGPTSDVALTILEDMISLHGSSASFRQIFKSQTATEILIDAVKTSNDEIHSQDATTRPAMSVWGRLTHFCSLVASNNVVSSTQKTNILDVMKLESQPKPEAPTGASRLSVVQEEAARKALDRLQEWRRTTSVAERRRYQKTVLDLRENRRQISFYSTRMLSLTSERDLWVHPNQKRSWQLDETEGPHRIRKKLEPVDEGTALGGKPVVHRRRESLASSDSDIGSLVQGDHAVSQDPEDQLTEEVIEDKHRRVRHELEPGDVIEAVSTVSRVSGVDCFPGLLIIGCTHLYMLDGLVENEDGEVIDAHDAPRGLFFISGSSVDLRKAQRAQRWTLDQLAGFGDRAFLFQDVALEIFFQDSRTLLAVFLDKARRQEVTRRLQSIMSRLGTHDSSPMSGVILSLPPNLGRVTFKAKAFIQAREKELLGAQRKWQNREISNFAYLSVLNQLSGRTPSDATQYPVLPWVLKDYSSDVLDLSAPETYRDLTKPMGALTDDRRESAQARYENLESVGEKPFHYGTHFSSSMIVCHFLIRMAPFTNMFKTLQSGIYLIGFLCVDIGRAYASAAKDIRGDVRELIPEFYTCPEFLENSSRLDFGVSQSTGEKVDDVKLPPWAKNDPLLFVHMHRRALESHHVSENLPAWIDLIWGCKQRDESSLNVFHPLSYEGSIDLDKITDDLEREATVGIIHNFGQTPRKLFTSPHPPRNMQGLISLPFGVAHGIPEDTLALVKDRNPLKVILQKPVANIIIDGGGKIVPTPHGMIHSPSHLHEQVKWDGEGGTLQLLSRGKVVQTLESVATTCAAFADTNTLITGSSDFTVRVWHLNHGPAHASSSFSTSTGKMSWKDSAPCITLLHLLRAHTAAVVCLAASRTWSVVVSGSRDGSAVTWDLNRGCYGMSIWHPKGDGLEGNEEVHLVAVNESTGCIATCSASQLWLHTINARPIARLDLSLSSPSYALFPPITSLAFHEREYSHLELLATGNVDGSITLWTWNADGTPKGCKAQWEFVEVRRLAPALLGSTNAAPAITALRFNGETLIAGGATGETHLWSIPS